MNYTFITPLLLLGLLINLHAFPATAQDNFYLHGKIVQPDSHIPVPGASIVNLRSQQSTLASQDGQFSIKVVTGDTLLIRSLGFKIKKYLAQAPPYTANLVIVELEQDSISLQEVEITGLPSPEELLRRAKNEKANTSLVRNPHYIPKPEPFLPQSAPVVNVNSPISAMYGLFSREGKQLSKLEELKKREKKEKEQQERQNYNRFFKDNTGYE